MREKNNNLKWKITPVRFILPVILAIILFVLTFFLFVIPSYKSSIIEDKKEMIHELTNTAWSVLNKYENDVKKGLISKSDAQIEAIAKIKYLRYGKDMKDYFWINDMTPKMIMHPYRSDLNGKPLHNFSDPNGKKLFLEFVKTVKAQGDGFVYYVWQWKDDSTCVAPKLSYVKGFAPWGWIIGTGVYINDINEDITKIEQKLIKIFLLIILFIALLHIPILLKILKVERKKRIAETDLNESEEKYKTLIENAPDAIIVYDLDLKTFVEANLMAVKLSGCTKEELLKSGPLKFYAVGQPDNMPIENSMNENLEKIMKGEQVIYERLVRDCIGKEFYCEIRAVKLPSEKHNLIRASFLDITLRKEAENTLKENELKLKRKNEEYLTLNEELKKSNQKTLKINNDLCVAKEAIENSEKKFKTLLELAVDAFFQGDSNGNFINVNYKAIELTGYSKEELINMNINELFSKEVLQEKPLRYDLLNKGLVLTIEREILRKDNTKVLVEMKTRKMPDGTFQGFFRDISERIKSELQLRKSEILYRTLFENTGTAMVIIEEDTLISLANTEFETLSGFPKNEIEGKKSWTEFVVPEDLAKMKESHNLRRINSELAPKNYEFRLIDKYKNIKFIYLSIDVIQGTLKSIASLLDITERKLSERKIYNASIEGEENERSRIAKDLHDGLGPLLSTCKIFAYTLTEDFPEISNNKITTKLLSTLEQSIRSVKEISNNISPHILRDFGFIYALKNFLNNLKLAKKIDIQFESNITTKLDKIIETSLYRVLTELINNTIKHANASKIDVNIQFNKSILHIFYADNGKGFNIQEKLKTPTGMGLINIKNRVHNLNGLIDITSETDKGTIVSIVININKEEYAIVNSNS